ncbi:hypothetical protein [Paenibacillus sp. FSL R7-0331]|uniref:hypothetical protein n=1 Tax=Paenibacillus sp. FSL R7-0331 TaxID=1536773 RepID=UPI0004F7EAE5|nr:hypothetical protein [Paenibacillus sp. FSL R7-0331]AIQ54067.1 hypothetical protein R70331_22720 [Paenibacillus sp. FSL R7-0331]
MKSRARIGPASPAGFKDNPAFHFSNLAGSAGIKGIRAFHSAHLARLAGSPRYHSVPRTRPSGLNIRSTSIFAQSITSRFAS